MSEVPAGPNPALAYDVLVVGFGPVGKLLAIQLARAGHEVLVVDRQVAGYPLPRAVTHDSEFARIMQSIGLPPSAIPDVVEPYDEMYRWRNAAGETLLEVDWSGTGPSGWHNTYFFHQPSLENRMEKLIDGLASVTVLRGWEAFGHEMVDDGVAVQLRSAGAASPPRAANGADATAVVSAAYVVGADGANSIVRDWLGSSWHDLGYFYDWLVVDVAPDPSLRFPHVAIQSCDPARPSTMVPGGPGRRRWEFMRLPGESRAELNRTEVAWKLLEPYGVDPLNARLERHSVYTFQAGWATIWRRGRLMIAGDAAHLMPPFAGQGLGAGVRDVMNLAWKLSAVLHGDADEALLATYGPERTPHVAAFIEFSMSLGRVICITDPDEARERDRRLMADWAATRSAPTPPHPALGAQGGPAGPEPSGGGPVGARPQLDRGVHAGTLSIQGRVGAARELLDDALGGAGVLLVRAAALLGDVDPGDLERLAAVGVQTRALTDDGGGPPFDADGTYAAWLAELVADAVLIRPDFYVYGTATAEGVAELVAGFLAALRPTGVLSP